MEQIASDLSDGGGLPNSSLEKESRIQDIHQGEHRLSDCDCLLNGDCLLYRILLYTHLICRRAFLTDPDYSTLR